MDGQDVVLPWSGPGGLSVSRRLFHFPAAALAWGPHPLRSV